MTRITPIQFKEAFLNAVSSLHSELVTLWNARRDYTALMLNVAFPKIATELGVSVFNGDYYYFDWMLL